MDWKEENTRTRYIDSITWDEAKILAWLASGKPDDFQLQRLDAKCNGNNIPHVELHFRYFEPLVGDGLEDYIGIFANLNTYYGRAFHQVQCQKELFEFYSEAGFD